MACLGTQGTCAGSGRDRRPLCSQEHAVMRTETHVQTHMESRPHRLRGWAPRLPGRGRLLQSFPPR